MRRQRQNPMVRAGRLIAYLVTDGAAFAADIGYGLARWFRARRFSLRSRMGR